MLRILLLVSATTLAMSSVSLAFDPILIPGGGYPIIHPNGAVDEIIATAEQTGGQFGIVTLAGPAGDGPGPAIIHHTGTDIFYVLEGEAQLFAGDKKIEGGPGSIVIADAGQPHGYIAKTPIKMLVIFVPGGYEHFFEEWEKAGIKPGPDLGVLENRFGVTRPAP